MVQQRVSSSLPYSQTVRRNEARMPNIVEFGAIIPEFAGKSVDDVSDECFDEDFMSGPPIGDVLIKA